MNREPAARTILRLSQALAEAEQRKDADWIAPHLVDDYLGIDPSGEVIDKAVLLARYRMDGFQLDTLELADIDILVAGQAAMEVGNLRLAGRLGEKTFGGLYRYSHFWVLSDRGWQISRSQMTPVLR